ncbi:hypothetical protein ACFRCI_47710 [Streptomyces sp. NPDC056638]|uniref:hypothetical protein n=1 Tax=Streptomyces sp. NPDC056638 TaxID=3345887 RepID=UPI0036B8FE3B
MRAPGVVSEGNVFARRQAHLLSALCFWRNGLKAGVTGRDERWASFAASPSQYSSP